MAIHLPFLPAERRIAGRVAPPETAFAIIDKHRGALRIVALSAEAAAQGLRPDMALADARALVPHLPAFPHDPAGDGAMLMRAVEACERYTPMVAPDGEDALVLDLTGCFEGQGWTRETIARDALAHLARMGLGGRAAHGPTPDAALALARFGMDELADLPVAALALGAEADLALRRAGLRTIGALAARPRAPLAARFGRELPVRLARLLGEEDRRITPHRPAGAIRAERRFAEPLASVAPLLDVIEGLAQRLESVLARRGEGGRRFDVALFRTDGHVARLAVACGRPLRDPPAIRRLFSERLESLSDPLDPGFGYDMARMAVPLAERLENEQRDLACGEGGEAQPDLAPLLDRLAVRFGPDRIRRFHPRDEHLPEYAARPVPPESGPAAWPRPEPGEPPLRPLFLYDPPRPVGVVAEVPDGPPRRFVWRGKHHRVVRHEGPERIAYPWWKHPEGRGPTRDYYRVEDEMGQRFWLFRHGLYASESDHPQWYLHGLFA
ncbi:DNA polymerase Y family protein [Altererythrobacter marinus]|uniref:DNA polymerase Y family protein n=2 Tax=Pelagerythrobacter marinus TaxID=538382 RepID=A0ABW9URC4_9SPHN|nr:DNA polymerase Y family protein [Pelagerythrobacter marinus]MXO67429.1 DNA polymerase Y family protein [Pelagerythrobacter marinus]